MLLRPIIVLTTTYWVSKLSCQARASIRRATGVDLNRPILFADRGEEITIIVATEPDFTVGADGLAISRPMYPAA